MRETDIAIIGGGLAGSLAAAMLGRAGHRTVLIDPNTVYPPDFRCEKLDEGQVEVLKKTGLADEILRATTYVDTVWVARYGHLIDIKRGIQYGVIYDNLVNAIRALIPPSVEFIADKASAIATSQDRQAVTLANGDTVSARLVVLANGLSVSVRDSLGLTRTVMSPCHSITVGFDLIPAGKPAFDFPALTYYPEHPSDRAAYITLFPVGTAMRANLMVYRDMNDPWLRRMRHTPEEALAELMPGLSKLTGDYQISRPVQIRPADLYVTSGHRQDGVVLVGDAFCTSCPAAGTGTGKVFTDVERLCNVYIPQWLASPGMADAKIAAFYDDPVKRANDAACEAKAYRLKSRSIETDLKWRAERAARFAAQLGIGTLRRARAAIGSASAPQPVPPAALGKLAATRHDQPAGR